MLDNRHIGITPTSPLLVLKGTHSVKLQKYGYKDWRARVRVKKDMVLRVRMSQAGYGTVRVLSEPPNALVFLDGQKRGKTPLLLQKVPAGAHRLSLTLPEFMPIEQEIVVQPRAECQLSVKLPSKTEEYLANWIKRNPNDLSSHVELLHIYAMKGKLQEAKATLIAALKLWMAGGVDEEAVQRLDQEIRKTYTAEYDVGGEDALDALRLMIETTLEEVAFGGKGSPPQPAATVGASNVGLLLASLFESTQKWDKARATYERLTQKWPNALHLKRAYGLLLFRLQQIPDAAKVLESLVSAGAGDAQVHQALASAYMNLQKTEDALRVLLRGADLEGLTPAEKINFETQLASIFHAQSKFAQAAERWEKAWPVGENPDQQAQLQLAAAQEHMLAGNLARARELYTLVINGAASEGMKARARDALKQ